MGVGGQRHAPAALPPEAGWAPGPVWTGAENLAPPPRDLIPGRLARSESLYRLSYRGNKWIQRATLKNPKSRPIVAAIFMRTLLSVWFIISSWDIRCFMHVIRFPWLIVSRSHGTSPERGKTKARVTSDATGNRTSRVRARAVRDHACVRL